MTTYPFVCNDGKTRWPRMNEVREKQKKEEEPVPTELAEFEKLYGDLSEQFCGERLYFSGKSWKRKKILLIMTTLENIKEYKLDLDLFLLAQFEHARKYPKAIWPTSIASLRAVKTYQDWIAGFANHKEARSICKQRDVQEVLAQNHRKFCHYRDKLGWSQEAILTMKAGEFDPIYLLTIPGFMDLYEQRPEAFNGCSDRVRQAMRALQKIGNRASSFWKMARSFHCQQAATSLSFTSKAKY